MSLYEPVTGKDLKEALGRLDTDYLARFSLGWNTIAKNALEDIKAVADNEARRQRFTSENDHSPMIAVDLRNHEGLEEDGAFRSGILKLGFVALLEDIESVPSRFETQKGKLFEDVDAFINIHPGSKLYIRERRIYLPEEDAFCGKLYALSSSQYIKPKEVL